MKKKSNGWSVFGAIGAIAYVAYKERQRDKLFRQSQQRQQVPPHAQAQPVEKPQPPKPTKEELHTLYLALSKKYHPDRAQSETDKEFRAELFKKLKDAYERGDMATLKMYQLNQIYSSP